MANEFSQASFKEENSGISLGEKILNKFKKTISSNEETRKEETKRTENKVVKKQIKVRESQDFKILPGEKPVKIMSLMGLEQVGQCLLIEYENDMIIVDAGMEFAAADDVLWADYIIPDISYVKQNLHKLRWILLTHGHLDHIWALRDILPELNRPTIYTTPLTLGIVKRSFQSREQMNNEWFSSWGW